MVHVFEQRSTCKSTQTVTMSARRLKTTTDIIEVYSSALGTSNMASDNTIDTNAKSNTNRCDELAFIRISYRKIHVLGLYKLSTIWYRQDGGGPFTAGDIARVHRNIVSLRLIEDKDFLRWASRRYGDCEEMGVTSWEVSIYGRNCGRSCD